MVDKLIWYIIVSNLIPRNNSFNTLSIGEIIMSLNDVLNSKESKYTAPGVEIEIGG